ncbi:MAG: type II secretion system protein GspD [Fimbriimonas sp.]
MTVVAGLVVAPVGALAQQSSDVRVDINLKDADMMAATNILFQRTGIQFVVEPSSKPYNKITLKLQGATPEEAVSYICQSAGAYFRRDENGVYIISPNKPVVEAAPVAPAANAVKIVKKLKVLKGDARVIYESIAFKQVFDPARGFAELKRFVDIAGPTQGHQFQPMINVLGNGPAQTFAPVYAPNQNTPLTGGESARDIKLPGESAGQLGGLGGGGGGGLGGQGGGLGGGGGGLGGQGGGGGQGVTLQGGQGLVGSSIDYITFDPVDNSFIVRGTEEDINQLQTYISMFDIAPRQVQIKVEFITTTEALEKSLGTEFLYQRGTILAGTRPGAFVRSTDPVFLNYATGNITARLRASLVETGGKVVSAPILRTMNNQPASITSSVQTTIFINTSTISNGTVITTSNPLPLLAATQLSVAPRINEDNTITMFLAPQIQSFVGVSRGPDGTEIPNVVSQFIAVVARVRNGETIVLGGLNNKNEDQSVNRVPILSDLPIIGQFFKQTRKSRLNQELLIFVTPTIVDEDTSAGPGGP